MLSDSRVVAHTQMHVIWHEQPAYHRVCHLSSTCQTDGLLEMTDRLQTEMRSSNIQTKRICSSSFCLYVCLSVCLCEQEKSGGEKGTVQREKLKIKRPQFLVSGGGSKNWYRKQR